MVEARDIIAQFCDGYTWAEVLDQADRAIAALTAAGWTLAPPGKFKRGDRVTKISGSSWTGRIVGTYSTTLSPEGYAVESENEPGSVQIYPVSALRSADD